MRHFYLQLRAASTSGSPNSGLVSCEWLKDELSKPSSEAPLRVVDATWYLPNSAWAAPAGSPGAEEEHKQGPRIPGATFFDIEKFSSEHPDGLPHMMPDPKLFAEGMANIGVDSKSRVVVYDRLGLFSAARFWYMLKVCFNHPNDVAVLDGGFLRWQQLGLPVETGPATPQPVFDSGDRWNYTPERCWDVEKVKANLTGNSSIVIDARPAPRFQGTAEEPRAGMKSGHIPNSLNVPFPDLLDPQTKLLKDPEELEALMMINGIPMSDITDGDLPVVTSCGSGVTACMVGLSLHQLGMPLKNWAVYDGSWTEWGGRQDTPVEQGPSKPFKSKL